MVDHYKRFDGVEWLQPLWSAVRKTNLDGASVVANQAIVTLYKSGSDCIGWHADKPVSIASLSTIFDVSLGGERTLCIREREGAPVHKITMQHGSAVAFTTEFNARHEHAVLPEPGASPRASIVFRDIATIMSDAEVHAKVNAAA